MSSSDAGAGLLRRARCAVLLVWNNVTIEPVVMLYLTAYGLNEVVRPTLLIEKACRAKLNYSQEICDNINDDIYDDEYTEVSKAVSQYESVLSSCAFLPRIFYAIVAGAWSDRHGRKFILALPMFGQVLANITFMINYAFLTELPFEALSLEFVNEVCGNFVLYYLAEYSYISDVTSEAERTSRISIVDGTDYIFTMVGTAISGVAFATVGYFGIFGAGAVCDTLGVLYVAFVLKESIGPRAPPSLTSTEGEAAAAATTSPKSYGSTETHFSIDEDVAVMEAPDPEPSQDCCGGYIPRPHDFVDGFKTLFKRRPGPYRMLLLVLCFNFACYIFVYNGTEGSHRLLYAQDKYGWTTGEYSAYLALYRICYLVTLWLALPALSRYVGLHDATVATVACVTGAAGLTLPALVTDDWAMYAGSVIAMFGPAATISTRAMASKCVGEEEVGRIFAIFSLISATSSSLVYAAFQSIYRATLDSFLGAFLIVTAGLYLITIPNNLLLLRRKL